MTGDARRQNPALDFGKGQAHEILQPTGDADGPRIRRFRRAVGKGAETLFLR
ncbi:hypothetical protein [Aliiruegeria lutimaris]|uniref:Uncharacterized protein n=1 Tax=Aliiruegeria lutimaris TaxID=571298 RepID=A0A1G9EBK0_9RHOB|nr:hypothetical protein [Aliiruegeria lutimaris]SDK73441.1 hypothetical protein SAMN04488026_105132 [Aliiruegeria lutimaris]